MSTYRGHQCPNLGGHQPKRAPLGPTCRTLDYIAIPRGASYASHGGGIMALVGVQVMHHPTRLKPSFVFKGV